MANVKVRSGVIRNAVGAILPNKTATLWNHATGVQIPGSVVTDSADRYTFPNLDETVRYEVRVAFGGGSSQLHVNAPISPDLDHAYINNSLRSAAGATVAFAGPVSTGALTVTGTLTATGALNVTGSLNAVVGISTDGNAVAETGIFEGLQVAGGALTVASDGQLNMTNTANFGGRVNTNLLAIGNTGQIQLPVNTLATPPIAAALDLNTGLRWPGNDQLQLVANGQEIARAWMNGATTQFASYAAQTFIQNAILIGGAMTTATSVSTVIRKILIQDASGNFIGWVPVYGAAG
jgi:hypothetical protein